MIDIIYKNSLVLITVGISKYPAQHFFQLCVFLMSLSRFHKTEKVEFGEGVNKNILNLNFCSRFKGGGEVLNSIHFIYF